MFLKVLNGFSQAIIIVLAFVLIITITTKHSSNAALEDFQKKVEERFQANDISYGNKIKTVEDNLNRYQQLREQRAQLYSARLDELYALYNRDPSPIISGKPIKEPIKAEFQLAVPTQTTISENTNYIESRVNKIDERLDTKTNQLDKRLDILEQRVNLLNSSKMGNVKVVQTNLNNQVVNNR